MESNSDISSAPSYVPPIPVSPFYLSFPTSSPIFLTPFLPVALEDPRTPNNSFLLGPQPPYWENTTVVFACFENSLFPSGRNYTWATFNGTDWLYADPDAACIKCEFVGSLVFPASGSFSSHFFLLLRTAF